MTRRVALVGLLLVVSVLTSTVAGASLGAAPRGFRLTSPAFTRGGEIPDGFTCSDANANPPLRWRGVPRGTVELALTMEDPDTARGTFVHWVVWGIDGATRTLPEAVVPAGLTEGANGTGQSGYLGPCPPPGDEPHRYRFTLYALDAPLVLDPTADVEQLRDAIEPSVIGTARLVGRYGR